LRQLRELRPPDGRPAGRLPAEFEVGVGYAQAHHGELLQGMFDDGAGRFYRALVT